MIGLLKDEVIELKGEVIELKDEVIESLTNSSACDSVGTQRLEY